MCINIIIYTTAAAAAMECFTIGRLILIQPSLTEIFANKGRFTACFFIENELVVRWRQNAKSPSKIYG